MDDGADLTLLEEPGLVLGHLAGFDGDGAPLVRFATVLGEEIRPARSAVRLDAEDLGHEVVLMVAAGDGGQPVVLGRLRRPRAGLEATVDGKRVEIASEQEITLRCAKASITLTRSGKIVLRGTDILSRSSGSNRMKGGSIQLN
jgi:hypothetical protein